MKDAWLEKPAAGGLLLEHRPNFIHIQPEIECIVAQKS
jgi:hypothetical protein